MKRRKQILAAVLAAITLSQGMATFADTVTNTPTGDQHTTIGIAESATDLSQTQFEVPLYVTTAAISGKEDLLCPNGYDISNTANAGGAIGVVSMTVEKIGTWDIKHTPTSDSHVKLTIGGQDLPEVNDGKTKDTVKFIEQKTDNSFYANGKLKKIDPGKTLSGEDKTSPTYAGLTISGKVANKTRTNKKAAAQFKVTYVVSPLDDQGNPIGNTYVGDNKADSGMQ